MPQPASHDLEIEDTLEISRSTLSCPALTQSSAEAREQSLAAQTQGIDVAESTTHNMHWQQGMSMDNNTGAGMAQSQEDSMYITPSTTPDIDKMEAIHDENALSKTNNTIQPTVTLQTDADVLSASRSTSLPSPSSSHQRYLPTMHNTMSASIETHRTFGGGHPTPPASPIGTAQEAEGQRKEALTRSGIPRIDQELNWSLSTPPRDYLPRCREPRYPSSLFQHESKYIGTQQSDRQIYNVNVRILTIDTHQSTCTGYLLIKGLTPEHDKLQTYFTGEIIGGPKQKYSFRTKHADWGASDKTDLMHWARFPAWRSSVAQARQDLDFKHPANGEHWWEQEHIFMRWKEHFLVPDHKTKSIAGASFEGFYYVCLNQVEGKISGIYFHSNSEKYQQLELRHEGEPGVFHRGVTPAIELR